MADLTANASLRTMGESYTEEWVLDNSAAQTVYKGQPMIIDQSEDTVYLRGFVDATVVAATDIFVGIALKAPSQLPQPTPRPQTSLKFTLNHQSLVSSPQCLPTPTQATRFT